MPAKRKTATKDSTSTATIGFETKLWLAADKLRNNMDAAEYKHVVLGLIFLKYISDTFEEHRAKLLAGEGDYAGANAEDPDEYKAENVFWVPADARWSHLQANANQPTIGKTVDDAMVAIERDNLALDDLMQLSDRVYDQGFESVSLFGEAFHLVENCLKPGSHREHCNVFAACKGRRSVLCPDKNRVWEQAPETGFSHTALTNDGKGQASMRTRRHQLFKHP
jgi:hypothetical protein